MKAANRLTTANIHMHFHMLSTCLSSFLIDLRIELHFNWISGQWFPSNTFYLPWESLYLRLTSLTSKWLLTCGRKSLHWDEGSNCNCLKYTWEEVILFIHLMVLILYRSSVCNSNDTISCRLYHQFDHFSHLLQLWSELGDAQFCHLNNHWRVIFIWALDALLWRLASLLQHGPETDLSVVNLTCICRWWSERWWPRPQPWAGVQHVSRGQSLVIVLAITHVSDMFEIICFYV